MDVLPNLAAFVEIDVPGAPVRVFEPIQLELEDHSVVEVVRVDHRVSAQLGSFLTTIDTPTTLEGAELVEHVRRAFGAAKRTVDSIATALDCARSTTISISVENDGNSTVISCSNNV